MANEMTGKVAVITGGARGLGAAMAARLGQAARFKRCDVSIRDNMAARADAEAK